MADSIYKHENKLMSELLTLNKINNDANLRKKIIDTIINSMDQIRAEIKYELGELSSTMESTY